jgi:hypothetical protein
LHLLLSPFSSSTTPNGFITAMFPIFPCPNLPSQFSSDIKYWKTSVCNTVFFSARFYCALITLHVSAPFGGHLQVVHKHKKYIQGIFTPFIIPHYMFRPPYRPSSSAYTHRILVAKGGDIILVYTRNRMQNPHIKYSR